MELVQTHPEHAEELLAEARFSAAARRQTPFIPWNRGARICTPGMHVPGADVISPATGLRLGSACLHPTAAVEDLLARFLVACTARMTPGTRPMELDGAAATTGQSPVALAAATAPLLAAHAGPAHGSLPNAAGNPCPTQAASLRTGHGAAHGHRL